jgi:hypothetical protein
MRTGTVNVSILRGGVMEHPGDVICEDGDGMIVLRGDLEPVECHYLLMAVFCPANRNSERPLSGVKRTWRLPCEISAFDPKRTFNVDSNTSGLRADALHPVFEAPAV